ncbi:MAG: FKBP-type peptidyl-prolyl cis-trans isomerase, partial [Candidatus Hydrothermarchaeales archaeon]
MGLKKGDFIRINYTGKTKGANVFDTTLENVAKEHDIYDEKVKFKPAPVVVGEGHVIKGVDEALVDIAVGGKKKLEILPEKGYGPRDPKLVKVVPLKDFRKQGMTPVPGMRFESEGGIGRVQSVGAGRVRVDFNYELAGRILEYEVSVEGKVNKVEDKLRLLMELRFPYADHNKHEIAINAGKAVIVLAKETGFRKEAAVGKQLLARDAFKFLDTIKEVEF